MTYSQIAAILGKPKAARAVGNILHRNKNPEKIPCHRVVNKQGKLAKGYAFGGEIEQKRKLGKEGIEVGKNFRVDLKKYQYFLNKQIIS